MNISRRLRLLTLGLITVVMTGLIHGALISPAQAHWADLAVAEIQIQDQQTEVALTLPTGLIAIADVNQDQRITSEEVATRQTELRQFLSDRLILKTDSLHSLPLTAVRLLENAVPSLPQVKLSSHSTLNLNYDNPQKSGITAIAYHLFLPGVPTATCVATIIQRDSSQQFIFSPQTPELILNSLTHGLFGIPVWTALLVAFGWGAFHSLSPGHGKTIVGAYLTGAKATAQHALFLGLTTTVTHTTGVILLGLGTLVASKFIRIEEVLPWISVFSGVLIVSIGLQLLRDRFRQDSSHDHSHGHTHHPDHAHRHPEPIHSHDPAEGLHEHTQLLVHAHDASHAHDLSPVHDLSDRPHVHTHTYAPHGHSHAFPRLEDESTIRWGSLFAIGISGGLVPCPSALILLLSSISLGQTTLGLVLVLAFSLGLASVLTGLGLLLIYARHRFERISISGRWLKLFPMFSASLITLLGLALTIRAVLTLNGAGSII